jgi:Rod binding domain-containing protein
MDISSINSVSTSAAGPSTAIEKAKEVREVFQKFVGETFYQQMFKSMRSTLGKPAYFHGGRGEEVFTSQLDQTLSQSMANANGGELSQGMFRAAFPQLHEILQQAELDQTSPASQSDDTTTSGDSLDNLSALQRR